MNEKYLWQFKDNRDSKGCGHPHEKSCICGFDVKKYASASCAACKGEGFVPTKNGGIIECDCVVAKLKDRPRPESMKGAGDGFGGSDF